MRLVAIDASAAYPALLTEAMDGEISSADIFIAPDVIVGELLNARWKGNRARVAAPSVDETLSFLGRIRIVPSLTYAEEAADLAQRLDHPVYDCLYIAVARRESVRLVTRDDRLIRKMRAHKLSSLLA